MNIFDSRITTRELRILKDGAAPGGGRHASRRETVLGRLCAAEALDQLGLPKTVVGRCANGEPRWPDGIVGSITHCSGYVCAAVAKDSSVEGVGIDAEPRTLLEAETRKLILSDTESERVERLAKHDQTIPWDLITFSAKESIFKSLGQGQQSISTYQDIEIELSPCGDFNVLRVTGEVDCCGYGRWTLAAGLVLTYFVREY